MARGAAERGKRIAFGNRRKIAWGPHSELIFRHNPNIARPGSEGHPDIEWLEYYKGHRGYNRQASNRWIWNYRFKAIPGEMFFSDEELEFGKSCGDGFVVVEPNVPLFKSVAPNKQWPVERYNDVAGELTAAGLRVIQFGYDGMRHRLRHASLVRTPDFRKALALLAHAQLAILPEGGLHHGAAAVGVKAVVLFGGFIPAAVTGYDMHINLTGGAEACGSLSRCQHCIEAMAAISVADVLAAASAI